MSPTIKDKIQEFGLTEVYCSTDPQVDVVLVHGLNGNPYNTWATQKPDVYWPTDLLPEFIEEQHCRILTYGYDANVTTFTDGASKDHIHNHAEHLAARLVANRSVKARERPIIFVAHSLGGLVVKRLLIYCESINNPKLERLRSIYVSTFGILFLGTPHNGSDLAKWGSLLQSICSVALPKKFMDSSPQLVNALKTNNETLQNINRMFVEIMDPLRIYFFHEAKPMNLKGTRQFVVEEDSAAPVIQGVERMGIERDHSHMCKFEDANAPGFDVVADAISSYAEEAPSKVHGRWEREKRIREYHRQSMAGELLGDSLLGVGQQTKPQTQASSARESRGTSMGAPPPSKMIENQSTSAPYVVEEVDEIPATLNLVSHFIPVPGTDSFVFTEGSVESVKALDLEASEVSIQQPRVAPLLFRPNSVFEGFEIELGQLKHKLSAEKRNDTGTCSVLICGPPGSGKSHLARQYVWTHEDEFPAGIFWVDCKSRESRDRYYWDIGQALGCLEDHTGQSDRSFITEVRKYLESKQGWLIVFDGIFFDSDDGLSDFAHYLPDSTGNSIIYTSIDPTLRNRHRLLNPSWIRMRPLSPRAACRLLFKSLGIHEYNKLQLAKAQELVRFYGYLPLGIHAAAHVLTAQGRPLEKFSPAASDYRLVNPFLEIVQALEQGGHTEATTLLILLCFLSHKVPFILLELGAQTLTDLGRGIKSADRAGGMTTDLDNTVSTLLRYGLVERELQTCSVSSPAQIKGTPHISRTTTAASIGFPTPLIPSLTQESSDLRLIMNEDSKESTGSSNSRSIMIDTIRIHTIVQPIVRDSIKASGMQGLSYNEWLVIAVQFLCASYEAAALKLRSLPGQGSVADYREYKSHVSSLWKLLPRSHKDAPGELGVAREELRHIYREIQEEIKNRSPSQSQSSKGGNFKHYKSIFETSSSSDEGPPTPVSDLTRASTLSWEKDAIKTGSPTHYRNIHDSYSDQALSSNEDDGYQTELDDLTSTVHSSQRLETARDAKSSPRQSADGSSRQALLQAVLQGSYTPYAKKDLGEFKPMPTVGRVSSPEVQALRPRSTSSSSSGFSWPFRSNTANASAEAALAAVQAKNDIARNLSPAGRKGSSGSEISQRSIVETTRLPLSERSTNAPLTMVAADTSLPPRDLQSKALQDARRHSRHMSTSPRLMNTVLEREAVKSQDGTTVGEDISITLRYSTRPTLPPQALLDHGYNASSGRPQGYTSVPMSRDGSLESTHSLLSAPAEPMPVPSRLNVSYFDSYKYPAQALPSIDITMGRSLDLGHSGGWANSPSLGVDDDLQDLELSNPPTRTAPATVPNSPKLAKYSFSHSGGLDIPSPKIEEVDETTT